VCTGKQQIRQAKMKLGTINHIALTVADLERSEAFYKTLLEFLGYEQAENTPQLIL
jgi:glyoxylase I family protein